MAIEYGLNEEQEMLKKMARDFFANECPMTSVRKLMADETGFSPELWKKMAELDGWAGVSRRIWGFRHEFQGPDHLTGGDGTDSAAQSLHFYPASSWHAHSRFRNTRAKE